MKNIRALSSLPTWSRREFILKSTVGLAALGLLPTRLLNASDKGSDLPGIFKNLRDNVGTFNKNGGTIGFLKNKDAFVVIDSQFHESASALMQYWRTTTDQPVDLFFNTHYHLDHTQGNRVFAPESRQMIAHRNVPVWQKKWAEKNNKLEEQAYASVLFDKSWTADVGDETVTATHYGRAHTNGDSVIHFEKANVAHVGDLVFNRMPCYIDRDAGAIISAWADVLEKLHATYDDETLFIFGHGSDDRTSGSRQELLVMRDFLHGLLDYAEKGLKAGQSEDEVAATKILPDFPEHYMEAWASGISDDLRVAYKEVRDGPVEM